MHPFISYDMGLQASEERRTKALKVFSWLAEPDGAGEHPVRARDADVIEVLFGAQCEVEDAIA